MNERKSWLQISKMRIWAEWTRKKNDKIHQLYEATKNPSRFHVRRHDKENSYDYKIRRVEERGVQLRSRRAGQKGGGIMGMRGKLSWIGHESMGIALGTVWLAASLVKLEFRWKQGGGREGGDVVRDHDLFPLQCELVRMGCSARDRAAS